MRRGDACVARHGWPARPIPTGDACVAPYCVPPGGPDCPRRDESPDFGRSPAAGTPSGGYPNPAWMFERPGSGAAPLSLRAGVLSAPPVFLHSDGGGRRRRAPVRARRGPARVVRTCTDGVRLLGRVHPADDAREQPGRPTYPTESGCLGESVRRWSWSGVMHFTDDDITFT